MPVDRRPWLALAAALVLATPALAQRASSHLGVELAVPAGYRWVKDRKAPKPTTVVFLEGTFEEEPRPQILVNHIKVPSSSEADVYKLFLESLEGMGAKHDEVELPSGRFLRVDFALDDPPRRLKQRWYVAVREQRVFQFVLANVDEGRFEELVGSLDSAVASARFFPPEPAKPDAPPPTAAKPEPAKPAPAKPEPAKPEPAKPEPAKPAPDSAPVRSADPVSLRAAQGDAWFAKESKLVSVSSEYDPDFWTAKHLFDLRSDKGWCSQPGKAFPHRIVVAAPMPVQIAAFAFDNACPVEPGFEGAAAQDFEIEASVVGPNEGYTRVLKGRLASGVNGQRFELKTPVEARWLRLSILSNHGHQNLTELMELRVWPAGSAAGTTPDRTELRLEKLRASRQRNGDAVPAGESFRVGERVWVNLKPRGLTAGADGKYSLEVDLVLEDAQGRSILRRDKVVDQTAHLPAPPLSPFVALHLDLPEGFPGGSYVIRVVARDRLGSTSAAGTCEFTVKE